LIHEEYIKRQDPSEKKKTLGNNDLRCKLWWPIIASISKQIIIGQFIGRQPINGCYYKSIVFCFKKKRERITTNKSETL